MKKLLTVLIPTYNNYDFFLRVVRSYLNDERIEMIVSDDSDNQIEKNYIKSRCEENNIKYFEGLKQSPSENWNYLLKMVKTPFFVLNHHDDFPSNLKFLDSLDETKTGLIILPCSSKIGDEPICKMFSWQQKYFSKICMLWPNAAFNMISAPTASIIVNSKYKNQFFDQNLKWFIDAEWYYRLFKSCNIDKIGIIFFNNSRIYSFQALNSITQSLKGKLKKQITKEKNYLRNKGLIPKRIFILLQMIFFLIIFSVSKFPKIYAKIIFCFVIKIKKFSKFLLSI